MTTTARALYAFFSSFGVPAYVKSNIPDGAEAPYITYDLIEPEPLAQAMIHAWVWVRSTSYIDVSAITDAMKAAIDTGLTIPTDGGFIAIFRDKHTPFAQTQDDPNPDIKCAYLTMVIECNTN